MTGTSDAVQWPLLVLVDDDAAVLEALEAELRPRFGNLCRIEAFSDPRDLQEAMRQWASERRPMALLIADQRMPGVTGIELIRQVRSGSVRASGAAFDPTAATRTVLLTGYGGPEVAHAAKTEAGASRYREKPWSGSSLARDIESLLGEYWSDVQSPAHPAHEQLVSKSELRRLWSQLQKVSASPASGANEDADAPGEIERIRDLLRASLSDTNDSGVSSETLAAFLEGRATAEELDEVRSAAFASSSFRRDLAHLLVQVRNLSGLEARLRFDEIRPPDWLRTLQRSESQDDRETP